MPYLDLNGRLTIPSDLRKKVNLNFPDRIAICYDFLNNAVTICNEKDIQDKYVLAFRELDTKGRFSLPEDVPYLLGLQKVDIFIVFLKNNELCIKGMDGTGT